MNFLRNNILGWATSRPPTPSTIQPQIMGPSHTNLLFLVLELLFPFPCTDCWLCFDVDGPFDCPRTETVQELARMLDDERVVLVRGTPTSGKSTLARLLDRYYERHNVPSVCIDSWPQTGYSSFRGILVEQARDSGYPWVTRKNLYSCDIVFIIDEAQMSYHDHGLWLGFVKCQASRYNGPRVCLFCSYGSPSGTTANLGPGSPVGFIGIQKRVSLTVSSIPHASSICLFYNRAEIDDTIGRLCCNIRRPLSLDDDARDYIFDLTNGQPGAVDAIVAVLRQVRRVIRLCCLCQCQ